MSKSSRGPSWNTIPDSERRESRLSFSDEVSEDVLLVESDQKHLLDALDLCKRGQMMPDDWLSSDREQRLRRIEREWPEPCT